MEKIMEHREKIMIYKKCVQAALTAGLCVAGVSARASLCTAMPSCESLGYSASIAADCTNSLSCPFDTTYKICLDRSASCAAKECGIGDIYYSDGMCTASTCYDSSKAAVGVVFMLTDCDGNPLDDATTSKHGRVVNLRNLWHQDDYLFDASKPYSGFVEGFFYWGLFIQRFTNLTNYTESMDVTTSDSLGYALINNVSDIYDGKSYTQKIVADVSSTDCSYSSGTEEYAYYCRAPAAEAANAFYPPNVNADDPKVGAGKWYLPAEGELAYLYGIDTSAITHSRGRSGATGTTKKTVNKTLSILAEEMGSSYAATLTNGYHWSSMPEKYNAAFRLTMSDGTRESESRKYYSYVRAVLAF
jgi:hypothetical protein